MKHSHLQVHVNRPKDFRSPFYTLQHQTDSEDLGAFGILLVNHVEFSITCGPALSVMKSESRLI